MGGPRFKATYKQLMETGVPGLRIPIATYTTVKLQTQRAAFLIKEFLLNNLAASAYDGGVKLTSPWVMQWSCDGTTGPANDADATDRITDHTKFATRVDSSVAPISFYVLRSGTRVRAEWVAETEYEAGAVVTNGGHLYVCQSDGESAGSGGPSTAAVGLIVDGTTSWLWIGAGDGYARICVAFRTAQDYFLSITMSTKYARAATPTHFPVAATNAAIVTPGGVHTAWLTGSDATLDRVLHISANDDGTGFRIGVARNNAIPTLGGACVLGRIDDEYADGKNGEAVLALPVFLWNVNTTALNLNSATLVSTAIYSYGVNTMGGVLAGRRNGTQEHYTVLLMMPIGFGVVTQCPQFSTDSFLTRRKWLLGYDFQSMPMTHVAGSSNDITAIIWGTVVDMHVGSPLGNTPGLLFGKRWFCFGVLLFPNPSQLEAVGI